MRMRAVGRIHPRRGDWQVRLPGRINENTLGEQHNE